MFGFIEEKLAQLLHIEFEPFILNDGSRAAMISKALYIRVLRALVKLWEHDGDDSILEPIDKESDVQGMRVIVSKYFYNYDVLAGLTNGATKETDIYESIMNSDRMDYVEFERLIVSYFNDVPEPATAEPERAVVRLAARIATATATGENATPTVEAVMETVASTPKPKKKSRTTTTPEPEVNCSDGAEVLTDGLLNNEVAKKMKMLADRYGINFQSRSDDTYKIYKLNGFDVVSDDTLFDMAQKLKRNIIIGDDYRYLSELKKHIISNNPIDQAFLLIVTNPENAHVVEFYRTRADLKVVAFSHDIYHHYVINGSNVNREIKDIEDDSSLNKDQKQHKIDKLLSENRNSPYAKYDKIYKDTITNVVFALQDRNIIYFMFYTDENNKFTKIALEEITRRFDGSVSYDELIKIDSNYQEVLEKNNREEYVKFVTESAGSVIRQLKKAYEDSKIAYEDYLSKTMETGKMCSKLMEQVEAFNEGEHKRKIKERAFEEYNAVKQIPKINSVYIKDECIHVYTDNLYARDDRTKKLHDIGTFHIAIGMHSNNYDTNTTVKITNTKHQIIAYNGGVMQAPHVFSEGHICHGTLATGMINAYKNRDLYQLVFQLILFLQQANTDDAAGKYVNNWPIVSEEMIKSQEESTKKSIPTKVEFVVTPEDQKFDEAIAASIPIN